MTKAPKLKAPYPYFGGKSRVAALVWSHLGDVDNYIEPFAGSAATLLARPHPPRIETVNDADCYVANFWRATGRDPEAVVDYADGPVNEADLHARHRWLVLSDEAKAFRERMRRDPDYFDAKVAGWWCWGLCCWIGGGWCTEPGVGWEGRCNVHAGSVEFGDGQGVNKGLGKVKGRGERGMDSMPANPGGLRGVNGKKGPPGGTGDRNVKLGGGEGQVGNGIHAKGPSEQLPMLTGEAGASGRGVHAKGKRPLLSGHGVHRRLRNKRPQQSGNGHSAGVHAKGDIAEKRPRAHRAAGSSDSAYNLPGVLGGDVTGENRPQLADAFSRGRGVNGNDAAGTCEQRRAWLLDWFNRLRDRLRTVRVCCGNWLRVCDSESVTTRLGTTGIFFDPPYSTEAGRDMNLYGVDSGTVAHDVRAYCLERGGDPKMRLVLAGYEGEGHEALEAAGWHVIAWKAQGGYGNRSESGKDNAKKERLWISPHCNRERSLFDG